MKMRRCGNTDLELSVIGAGCWAFGGGDYWGDQNQKDVDNVVHASVDMGINYFDTAEVYNEGRSESSLGLAIKGISREKLIIGTKAMPQSCYPETLIKSCEGSLKRLGVDYIDIYMLHWPIHPHSIRHFTSDDQIIANPPSIQDAFEGMMALKEAGKIRHFGVSNFSKERLTELPSIDQLAVNELPYNLLCRGIEHDTLSYCSESGVGVIGYMALLQGILADIYKSIDDVPLWQRRTRHFDSARTKECRHGGSGCEEEMQAALQGIREICADSGMNMVDIAIRWILSNPAISTTLVGSRNVDQLKANVVSAEATISDELVQQLNKVTRPVMDALGKSFDYYESVENNRT